MKYTGVKLCDCGDIPKIGRHNVPIPYKVYNKDTKLLELAFSVGWHFGVYCE